jgi:hypothetical protein
MRVGQEPSFNLKFVGQSRLNEILSGRLRGAELLESRVNYFRLTKHVSSSTIFDSS